VLPDSYAGGGLTVTIMFATTNAANNVVWDAAIERIQEDTLDIDADSFAAVQSVTATAPATLGFISFDDITFTSGAQMDSLAAGEPFRIKVRRDADNASDTCAGDGQIIRVVINET
jgi:hypothetical protein